MTQNPALHYKSRTGVRVTRHISANAFKHPQECMRHQGLNIIEGEKAARRNTSLAQVWVGEQASQQQSEQALSSQGS